MKNIPKKNTFFRWGLNTAVILGVYFIITYLTKEGYIGKYHAGLMIPVCFYIILAVSLNMTCGFLGQLPLGHAGFMAVGAYTSAILTKFIQLPKEFQGLEFGACLLAGGLMAGLFGIVVGLPALRLKDDYLAIITLGFGEIIKVVIQNMEITGGAMGLKGVPKYTDFTWAYFCMVITVVVCFTLIRSRHGRAIISIRENEIASEACGINTTYYKTMTFTMAAFFAGIAGGLYAHYIGILSASTFGFTKSIEILVMVVLGGMGSITGSIIAATGLTVLPEMLRSFSAYRMIIYSLLLIVVMIFKPSGLMGRYEFSLGNMFGRKTKKEDGGAK